MADTSTPRRRILVVDDDPRLLHIVSLYLGIEGFDVVEASNGEDGLKTVEAQPPDLVILDIMMPGMDGVEACRQIRSNEATAHIPVLMFTALSSDDDVERARQAGANRLITKPFNLVGLGLVVKSFFEEGKTPEGFEAGNYLSSRLLCGLYPLGKLIRQVRWQYQPKYLLYRGISLDHVLTECGVVN